MLILALSYLGGVLTIFSPCVLPVVPFVFSRSDEPFRRSGLPMLVGMGLSFAFFGALSVTGGKWVIQASFNWEGFYKRKPKQDLDWDRLFF